MKKLFVIGNLAADAEVKTANGMQFVSFSVYDSRKYQRADGTIVEESDRVSCAWNGNGGNLFPYLKKGVKVFVEGFLSVNVYGSPVERKMKAGINLSVVDVQLCGGPVSSDSLKELVTQDGEIITPNLVMMCPKEWLDSKGQVNPSYKLARFIDKQQRVWILKETGEFILKTEADKENEPTDEEDRSMYPF